MQPISPEDLEYPDSRENVATKDYEPEVLRLDFSRYELPEEVDEPYQRPRGSTRPISMQSSDGTIIYFEYPNNSDPPDHRDNLATEDYKPEMTPLNLSRYELPEEIEELYQCPREPMQPISTDPDAESRISSDVSDQPATLPENFAQLREDEEISLTTASVVSVDDFFGNFSDDIFDYKPELTQSSDKTSGSLVETCSMIGYAGAPEIQDTPPSSPSLTLQFLALPSPAVSPASPSPLSLSPPSPVCHLDILPPCPDIPLDKPTPESRMSLPLPDALPSLPHVSLPQFPDQKLSPTFQTQPFLWSFITTASLFSKTPKFLLHSRSQPSESTDSETSSRNFKLGIDFEEPADLANYSDHIAVQPEPILTEVPNVSGNRPRVENDEITDLPNEHNGRPEAESAEYLSVLAEILADYEESNDSPIALHPQLW